MQNDNLIILNIEDLAKKYATSIKGYKLIKYYKAYFPVYKIESEIIMQRNKEIGLIQEYILKFINAGAKNINNLSQFLGLPKKTIESNLMKLHKEDLINFKVINGSFCLLSKGIDFIDKNKFIANEKIDFTFLVDAITGEYQLNEQLFKIDKTKRFIHLMPSNNKQPFIDDIELKDLRSIVNKSKSLNNNSYLDGDLIDLYKLEKINKCYRELNVLLFINSNQQYEIQVYDKNKRSESYENILIKMLNNGMKVVPMDIKEDSIDNVKDDNYLKLESIAKESNNDRLRIEKTITDLEESIVLNNPDYAETEEEFMSKTLTIEELNKRIAILEEEKKKNLKALDTYDHRPILIKALKEAEKQIVIVSPWIKKDATDFKLRAEIKKALERKVKVVICYGISQKTESDVKYTISLLDEMKVNPKIGEYLELINLGNTHEKVLICDTNFLVITSFNWLSFKGDPNRGFRQETGLYSENIELINERIRNLDSRIKEVSPQFSIIL